MSKHEYTIAFRGETLFHFTSVYDVQHVVVGYRTPTGRIEVLDRYKTLPVAVNTVKGRIRLYPNTQHGAYSAFVVECRPGTTEVSAAPVSYSAQHLTGVAL
jgi:hypothetical protein